MNPRTETLAEGVTLYLGDCREILPTLGKVDAVVTDPPYGINHIAKKNQTRVGSGLANSRVRAGRFSGSIVGDDKEFDPSAWVKWPCVLWGANYYHHNLPKGGQWLVWDKKCGVYQEWDSADGDIAWCSLDGAPRLFRLLWMGLVRGEIKKTVGGENAPSAHPNEKPVSLMEWSIQKLKLPARSIILDPFMGSGTTGIAAYKQDHRFIGIECDPAHFDTARKRISDELKQGRFPFNGPAVAERALTER